MTELLAKEIKLNPCSRLRNEGLRTEEGAEAKMHACCWKEARTPSKPPFSGLLYLRK